MHYLPPDDSHVKPNERSADLTKSLNHESTLTTFAAQAARSAFGRNYLGEGFDQIQDRSPGELAIRRAAGWFGSKR